MQLDRLEICGFMHFTAPAVLDLREIPPGLVAIVGDNGAGKTRLLDAAPASVHGPGAATGAFPSRDGTLADYATTRDAYIDSVWSVNERHYRAHVSVDGQRRASKAVLQQLPHEGNPETRTLNDGLVTTFRDVVAKIFPSRQQLLASAYAAQGHQGSFVGLGQAKRLELFAEMLGLDRMAAMSGTSKQVATVAERIRAGLVAQVESLARETAEEILQALRAEADSVLVVLEDLAVKEAAGLDSIERLEAQRQAHADGASQHLVSLARAQEIRVQVAVKQQARQQVAADLRAAEREATSRRSAAEMAATKLRTDLARLVQQARMDYDAKAKDLAERIGNCRAVQEQADAIRGAVAMHAGMQAMLAGLRERQSRIALDLDAEQSRLDAANKELAAYGDAMRLVQEAERKVATQADVPCHGLAEYAGCKFLADAQQALIALPGLKASCGLQAATVSIKDGIVAAIVKLRADRDGNDAEIRTAQAALAGDTLSAMAPQLADAEARIESYADQQEQADHDLDDRLKELRQRTSGAETELQAALYEIEQWLAAQQAQARQRTEACETELSELDTALGVVQEQVVQTQEARAALDALDIDLASCRRLQADLSRSAASLHVRSEENARRQAEFAARKEQWQATSARLKAVEDQMLAWRMLAQALGRDGLPKLEIDAAGPGVSDLTNQLLAAGFGTWFTVDLTTQVARADGKGLKEEFSIQLFDNQFGHALSDISDLSGGERVVVEEALRAGILLFNNSRQPQPIRTCWRDETTGALSEENVPRYVAMLRRMHELGGFRHTLFITHSADAARLADTVVRVSAGVPTVERAA